MTLKYILSISILSRLLTNATELESTMMAVRQLDDDDVYIEARFEHYWAKMKTIGENKTNANTGAVLSSNT